MAAQSAITLNSVVYSPRGRDQNGVASWQNTEASAAFPRAVTESVRGPSSGGLHRVSFKLTLPQIIGASDECGCEGAQRSVAICNIDVAVPTAFSLAERQALRASITALAAHATFVAAVENLEGAW